MMILINGKAKVYPAFQLSASTQTKAADKNNRRCCCVIFER